MFLPAGDQAGIERLVQYMTRCPFSLPRLVKVSGTGQVIYKAEKASCRSEPWRFEPLRNLRWNSAEFGNSWRVSILAFGLINSGLRRLAWPPGVGWTLNDYDIHNDVPGRNLR